VGFFLSFAIPILAYVILNEMKDISNITISFDYVQDDNSVRNDEKFFT
jgi:hypothetical protein